MERPINENPGVAGRGHQAMDFHNAITSRLYIIRAASSIATLPIPFYALDGVLLALNRGGLQ